MLFAGWTRSSKVAVMDLGFQTPTLDSFDSSINSDEFHGALKSWMALLLRVKSKRLIKEKGYKLHSTRLQSRARELKRCH